MPGTCGAWRVWRDVLEQVLTCGLHLKRLLREQVLRARPHRAWSAPNKGERSALSASAADQPASQRTVAGATALGAEPSSGCIR